MNGFYMGYDVSKLSLSRLHAAVQRLFISGLYAAGYQTLRLGDRSDCEPDEFAAMADSLRARGFDLDLTVGSCAETQMLKRIRARMATVVVKDKAQAEMLVQEIRKLDIRRLCLVIDDEADFAWAAKLADVVDLRNISAHDDFYDITRHRLDSCFDDDADPEHSITLARKNALEEGGRYHFGSMPLHFDDERNIAIYFMHAMLGCALVIDADLSVLSEKVIDVLKGREVIEAAMEGVGQVIRYYDPWHVAVGKNITPEMRYLLLLNRCHGDRQCWITFRELGWNQKFWSVRNLRTGVVDSSKTYQGFTVNLETSDHPLTPCCGIYLTKVIKLL